MIKITTYVKNIEVADMAKKVKKVSKAVKYLTEIKFLFKDIIAPLADMALKIAKKANKYEVNDDD